jgi:hypothetical protein
VAGQRQIVVWIKPCETQLEQHSGPVKVWRAVGGAARGDDLRMLGCGRQPLNQSVHFSRSECPPNRHRARRGKWLYLEVQAIGRQRAFRRGIARRWFS